MVNLAPLIMAFVPGENDIRTWVDLGLLCWLVTAAVRAAMVGTPKEIEFIANRLHRLYPEGFRNWREVEDVERDLLIGFWMGCSFGWHSPQLYHKV